MISSKIENKIIGKQYLGIEIFSNDKVEKINAMLVSKHNGELSVTEYYKFDAVSELTLDKSKNAPVVVTVNTDKVLIKEIDIVEKNDIILVKKAFPNLNLDEFYYDIWRLTDKSIISIVRKNYLDDLINNLKSTLKLKVATVFIGISTIKSITNYIRENTIDLKGRSFDKINNSLQINTSFDNQNTYEINGIKINAEDLLSFSAIVSFIISDFGSGSIFELNTIIKNEFLQEATFKTISRYTVFTLLVVLLINYVFFTHYFNSYQELTLKNELDKTNQSNLELLKKSVLEKEKKVKEIALSSSEKTTVKVNEIATSIPNTILLEELQFQPVEKKGSNEKLTLFHENDIEIKGVTTDNEEFTNWIELLSKKDFIKKVTILDFGKNENEELVFKISIGLNEVK